MKKLFIPSLAVMALAVMLGVSLALPAHAQQLTPAEVTTFATDLGSTSVSYLKALFTGIWPYIVILGLIIGAVFLFRRYIFVR